MLGVEASLMASRKADRDGDAWQSFGLPVLGSSTAHPNYCVTNRLWWRVRVTKLCAAS